MRFSGTLKVAAGALGAICLSMSAAAQTFPARPLRIIVAYGPVGGPDTVSRLIAPLIGADLGQTVVIENRGGGAGMPAINEVLNSPADGHTLFVPDAGHWAITPALQDVTYDFMRDFAPVGMVFSGPQIYVVLSSTGIKSLRELIDLAKAKPGVLNYGSPGIGSVHHLQGEVFKSGLGIDIRHVPYRGGGEMTEALLRGDVQFAFLALAALLPHVKSGKLTMLAVSSNTRFRGAPELPTVAEVTGMADFSFLGQMGVVVKAGTPRPVIDRVSGALRKALTNQAAADRVFTTSGIELMPTTPEQFADLIRADIAKYTRAVKVSGARP